jgi:hypothetical protein
MLARAKARFPAVPLERVGLQELAFDAEFDAVMCIDAMANIPPEDWPTVVGNLRRALRPGGHLYLTVEQVGDEELERVFAEATARACRWSGASWPARATTTTPRVTRWAPGWRRPGWRWWPRTTATTATATCTC